METIIKSHIPFKRIKPQSSKFLPLYRRILYPVIRWGGGSVEEFGGSRINRTRHIIIFGFHVLTIHRNEYHDRSEKERADEYLAKWSQCERELEMFRAKYVGEDMAPEIKQLIRESMGVDFDEGTVP